MTSFAESLGRRRDNLEEKLEALSSKLESLEEDCYEESVSNSHCWQAITRRVEKLEEKAAILQTEELQLKNQRNSTLVQRVQEAIDTTFIEEAPAAISEVADWLQGREGCGRAVLMLQLELDINTPRPQP